MSIDCTKCADCLWVCSCFSVIWIVYALREKHASNLLEKHTFINNCLMPQCSNGCVYVYVSVFVFDSIPWNWVYLLFSTEIKISNTHTKITFDIEFSQQLRENSNFFHFQSTSWQWIFFQQIFPFIWCSLALDVFVLWKWHQLPIFFFFWLSDFGCTFLLLFFLLHFLPLRLPVEIKCQTTISCSVLRIILLFYVPI